MYKTMSRLRNINMKSSNLHNFHYNHVRLHITERRLGSVVRRPRVLGQCCEMSVNDPRQICWTFPIAHGRQTALMLCPIVQFHHLTSGEIFIYCSTSPLSPRQWKCQSTSSKVLRIPMWPTNGTLWFSLMICCCKD